MERFQVGGAVRAGAWYGRRLADEALPAALLRGRGGVEGARLPRPFKGTGWASVLAPRQMGKSSLRVRTAELLAPHARVAAVDLAALGSAGVDAAGWFAGLAGEVAADLGVDDPVDGGGTPVRGWLAFLEGLLDAGPLVLFLDEIDVLRRLPFAGDLLGSLRAAHERGATHPLWQRLSVCLVGAVTPDALAAACGGAPFNIGTRIELTDFVRAELVPLEATLGRAAVDAIFAWTHGHPYMTARLGAAMGGDPVAHGEVDGLVQALFLGPGGGGETNLAAAERELLVDDGGAPERLETYRQALRGPLAVEGLRPTLVDAMVLSGMVAVRAGVLEPRNRVVRAVFDERWADRRLGQRSIGAAVRLWAEGGRRDEDLPRGQALAGLRRWSEGRADLTPEESRLLLRASEVLAEEAELRGAEERRATLEGVARSRGRMVAALAALSVVIGVTAVALVLATEAARAESRRATELQLAAEAVGMSRIPRLGTLALQRALAAVDVDPGADPPEVTRALAAVVSANQGQLEGSMAAQPACPGVALHSVRLGEVMEGAESVEGPDDAGPLRLRRVAGPGGRALEWEPSGPVLIGVDGVRTRLAGHLAGGVRWAAFTPHGLLTLGHDDTLGRWDPDSGAPLGAFLLLPGEPRTVSWCADGLGVWTEDDAGRVGVWGVGVRSMELGEGVPGAAWSGDSVLTVGADLAPRWRDPVDGTERAGGASGVQAWEVSPSGRSVFVGDVPEVRIGLARVVLPGAAAPYGRASWSADGARVVGAGTGGEVEVWEVARAARVARWGVPGATGTPVFGPDGSVAIGDDAGVVHVLGRSAFPTHASDVTAVAFSPDGTRIASASLDHSVVLRSLADDVEPLRLLGHASHVRAVGWSADGRWVASGGDDQTVRLWDALTGVEVAAYSGHNGVVRSVAFSPSGRFLVSTGDDQLAIVFPGSPDALVAFAAGQLARCGEGCGAGRSR